MFDRGQCFSATISVPSIPSRNFLLFKPQFQPQQLPTIRFPCSILPAGSCLIAQTIQNTPHKHIHHHIASLANRLTALDTACPSIGIACLHSSNNSTATSTHEAAALNFFLFQHFFIPSKSSFIPHCCAHHSPQYRYHTPIFIVKDGSQKVTEDFGVTVGWV